MACSFSRVALQQLILLLARSRQFSIQRVRYALQTAQQEYTKSQEMTCTMRVWHRTQSPTPTAVERKVGVKQGRQFDFSPSSHGWTINTNHGPELILTPNEPTLQINACCPGDFTAPVAMSERFTSFGKAENFGGQLRSNSRQRGRSRTPLPIRPVVVEDIIIPIANMTTVDLYGGSSQHQCNITTWSRAHYELTMENQNGHDMLEAFLRARLPKERIVETLQHRTNSHLSGNSGSTTTKSSFDIEAFTAVRMAERMENETMSEKFRRKAVRVFSSIEESKSWKENICSTVHARRVSHENFIHYVF